MQDSPQLRMASLALLAVGLAPAVPVQAQAQLQQLEVQGPPLPPRIVPNCRRNGSDEIVVCGTQERSPYRLPQARRGFDPDGGVDNVSRVRIALFDVGELGIGSCSNVGLGAQRRAMIAAAKSRADEPGPWVMSRRGRRETEFARKVEDQGSGRLPP